MDLRPGTAQGQAKRQAPVAPQGNTAERVQWEPEYQNANEDSKGHREKD